MKIVYKLLIGFLLLFMLIYPLRSEEISSEKELENIHKQIYFFNLKSARNELDFLFKKDYKNSDCINLLYQKRFVEIMILNKKELIPKWHKSIENDVRKIDRHESDEFKKNYLLSELYFKDCLLKFYDEKELAAISSFRKSYNYYNKIKREDAHSLKSLRMSSFFEIIIGLIPEKLNWIKNLTGLDGDLEYGLLLMRQFLDKTECSGNFYEMAFYYGLISSFAKDQEQKAWEYLINNNEECFKNPFYRLSLSMVGESAGKTADVLDVLSVYKEYHGDTYLSLLDLQRGRFLLYSLDKDADVYLKRYIKNDNTHEYFKLNALQMLYRYCFVFSKDDCVAYYKQRINEFAKEHDKIKDSNPVLKQVNDTIPILKSLLNARLLFDGAYYQDALNELNKGAIEALKSEHKKHKLEYFYLKARVLDEMEQNISAIEYYEKTLKYGAGEEWYYDVKSAIQLAEIYEDKAQFDQSSLYYKKALDINHGEYRDSFERQAKSGIKRIKKAGN